MGEGGWRGREEKGFEGEKGSGVIGGGKERDLK
jgi:hypothetical protein